MQSLGSNPTEIGFQAAPSRDRRSRVRHKVQLPAYTSLAVSPTAPALDLSEIINLNEDGMAIQTSSPLELNQRATFLLDLPETNTLIRTEGQVIWAGLSGRAGIKFSEMPPELNSALKKWLFANALAAYTNRTPEVSPETDLPDGNLLQVSPGMASEGFGLSIRPDYTAMLSAIAAVKSEVEALGDDLESALFLIARRAQTFTHADSAAIALTEGKYMVCCANSGLSAPPLGAPVGTDSGFSAECVRSGLLLRCDDSEIDSRVDRESCRNLGIRSMVATPIRSDYSTIGLLEVFSPEAHAFGSEAELVVLRLAEIISDAVWRAGSLTDYSPPKLTNVDDEFRTEELTDLSVPRLPRSRNALLVAAAIMIMFLGLWLVERRGPDAPPHAMPSPSAAQSKAVPAYSTQASTTADDLQALHRLAEQGDPSAQFAIGAHYATGEEVPQNYSEAVGWFTKAAVQGHVAAQATLGAYYWAGRGVQADLLQAYFWSFLAEAGGDEASRSRVALLASRLTREQIVMAQKQANDWLKQHRLPAKGSSDTY
jgi:GAF domain/PilZ domain/Sel1 repeat